MARIELAPEVLEDFERFVVLMRAFDIANTAERYAEIVNAIEILAHSPHIGRPVRSGLRELVIGRESRGYFALYRFVRAVDMVFVRAIRSQVEQDYFR